MPLEYKSIPFEVKEIVDLSGGGWEIAGYASTFGGDPDHYGDVVVRGAFTESIARRPTKFLYEHSEPIGRQLEIREDDSGLFGRWSIVDTRAGTDAYKLAKAGVLDSLSIGYYPLEADFREDGVRLLRKVDLLEVSAVAIPANESAIITQVKNGFGLSYEDHARRLQDAVAEFLGRTRSRSETWRRDAKAGAKISASRRQTMAGVRDALRSASGSVVSVADEIDALLAGTEPQKALNLGLELRRRKSTLAGVLERPASWA